MPDLIEQPIRSCLFYDEAVYLALKKSGNSLDEEDLAKLLEISEGDIIMSLVTLEKLERVKMNEDGKYTLV